MKFEKDIGVCEGFSYINLKNLKECLLSDGRSIANGNLKKNLTKKLKLLSVAPKIKVYVFV